MFPTFDLPQQERETVGARRERKARDRRASSSTTSTDGPKSSSSVKAKMNLPAPASPTVAAFAVSEKQERPKKPKQKSSGFGFFKKSYSNAQSKSEDTVESATLVDLAALSKDAPEPPQPAPIVLSRPPAARSAASPKLDLHIEVTPLDEEFASLPPTPPAKDDAVVAPLPVDAPRQKPPSRGLPAIPVTKPQEVPQESIIAAREVTEHISSTQSVVSISVKAEGPRTACSHMSMLLSPVDFYDDLESEVSDSEQTAVSYSDGWSPQAAVTKVETVRRMAPLDAVFEVRPQSRQAVEREIPVRSPPVAQNPFARALSKLENAGLRITAARLSEQWAGLDNDEESFQEIMFEKRLWALTAYQWLMNSKHLQSPSHEMLLGSRVADGRRILHLHGSLADGWVLAAKYPSATVYTVSSTNTAVNPTTYPAPLNHHNLYVPSPSSPLPFPDNHFDVVVSRALTTALRNDEWAPVFHDCKRVLKPGAWMEVLALDPRLSRSGPAQTAWTDTHVMARLRGAGMSMLPSDTVLDAMEVVGLADVRRARIALPANPPPKQQQPPPSPAAAGGPDAARLMAFLGRHLYQDLYRGCVSAKEGEGWFWESRKIRVECERARAKMLLTIACAQKPVP